MKILSALQKHSATAIIEIGTYQKERVITMTVELNYPPADLELIRAQAAAAHQSVEDFIMNASMKSARNAEYLAKIDRAKKRLDEGKGKHFTDEELEALFNGADI